MAGDRKIEIVVIDGRDFMRGGYKLLIGKHDDFEVVGETGRSTPGLRLIRELNPDVIVINNNKHGTSGIKTSQLIIDENPDAKILLVSDVFSEELVCLAAKAGVSGFLLEECIFNEQLSYGIRAVFRGEKYLCPKLMTVVANSWVNQVSAQYSTEVCEFPKKGTIL